MIKIFVIVGFSLLSVFSSNYVFKKMGDVKKIKEIKERLEELKDSKNIEDKLKSLEISSEYFKLISKPLIVSSLVSILFFIFALFAFGNIEIVKLPFRIPLIGERLNGIWLYVISSIVFSLAFRKIKYFGFILP
ncbi:MAG: hypothetical protein QW641_02545 [Candidatus Aenigmatarchaeota archaeon]